MLLRCSSWFSVALLGRCSRGYAANPTDKICLSRVQKLATRQHFCPVIYPAPFLSPVKELIFFKNWGWRGHAMAHIWRSADNLWELVLSPSCFKG